jgi:defect in organelle trafficking protein DotA
MNIFPPSAQDQSLYYLGQLFGYVGNLLPVQNPSMIVATMFKTFNTFMLVLGAFMIVYTTVVGLLATAHEGEFMGKKWSGLWVPLRSLFGIAALFPTASGYSGLQIAMMWIVIQGVGAADTVWNMYGIPH